MVRFGTSDLIDFQGALVVLIVFRRYLMFDARLNWINLVFTEFFNLFNRGRLTESLISHSLKLKQLFEMTSYFLNFIKMQKFKFQHVFN